MKQLTNYQRVSNYLVKIFKAINEEYFNNKLRIYSLSEVHNLLLLVSVDQKLVTVELYHQKQENHQAQENIFVLVVVIHSELLKN